MKIYITLIACLVAGITFAQTGSIGMGTETPNSNAVLELVSPENNQGLLVPRLSTTERTDALFTNNLGVAENGLLVYDSTMNAFYYWLTDQWVMLGGANNLTFDEQTFELSIENGNTVSLSIFVDGFDSDSTNELQTLSMLNDTISLSKNGGSVVIEKQDLELNGSTLSITNNPNATPINLAPFTGSNTDEQTLSLDIVNDSLSITNGNSVSLSKYNNYWSLNTTDSTITYDAGPTRIGNSFITTPNNSIISITNNNERINASLVTNRVLFVRNDSPQQEASVLRIDAGQDGQELILIGRSDQFVDVEFIASTTSQSGNGLMLLNGDMFLGFADVLHLIYIEDMGYWIELNRNFYNDSATTGEVER